MQDNGPDDKDVLLVQAASEVKRLRFWVWSMTVLLALHVILLALLVLSATRSHGNAIGIVEAKSFHVLDSDGKTRGIFSSRADGNPYIQLLSSDQEPVLRIDLGPDGSRGRISLEE